MRAPFPKAINAVNIWHIPEILRGTEMEEQGSINELWFYRPSSLQDEVFFLKVSLVPEFQPIKVSPSFPPY